MVDRCEINITVGEIEDQSTPNLIRQVGHLKINVKRVESSLRGRALIGVINSYVHPLITKAIRAR